MVTRRSYEWNRLYRNLFLSALLWLLFTPAINAAEPQLLLAAQGMISDGKPLDALDLLSPYEFEYAGEKEYDYLLGLSLLDSGQAGQSVFAFQRVLAIDPNFAGARMELARAYFDMSEFSRSRAEFTTLQSLSPPENIQLVIEKYLSAIRNRTLRDKRGWSGYVQMGAGNDSNANSAPAVSSFLGFTLAEQSRETESSVISTVAGVSYDLPVNYFRTYYVRSNLTHRSNNDATFSNSFSYDISTGMRQSFKDGDSTNLSLQFYSTDVDGSSNNAACSSTTATPSSVTTSKRAVTNTRGPLRPSFSSMPTTVPMRRASCPTSSGALNLVRPPANIRRGRSTGGRKPPRCA